MLWNTAFIFVISYLHLLRRTQCILYLSIYFIEKIDDTSHWILSIYKNWKIAELNRIKWLILALETFFFWVYTIHNKIVRLYFMFLSRHNNNIHYYSIINIIYTYFLIKCILCAVKLQSASWYFEENGTKVWEKECKAK